MAETTQEIRESSIVTLDDAVRLKWRASQSRDHILEESSGHEYGSIVPALDSDVFKAFQENLRIDVATFAEWTSICARHGMEAGGLGSLGVNQLLRAIYYPSGVLSESRRNFPLREQEHGNWVLELEKGQLFWRCIDYLKEIGHPGQFDTLINRRARMDADPLNGIEVKDAFYTAAHKDGWNYKEPVRQADFQKHFLINASPNHGETYLIDCSQFKGLDGQLVLVRTGNELASIKPLMRAVGEIGTVGGYVGYGTWGLSKELTEPIMRRLGIGSRY